MSVHSLVKKYDFHIINCKMEEMSHDSLVELLKCIPNSDKQFIFEFLKSICAYNGNQIRRDQTLLFNRVSSMPVNYRTKFILNNLLNYLLFPSKSLSSSSISENEVIRRFVYAAKCTSVTKLLTNKRMEYLFDNIQQIFLNGTTSSNVNSQFFKIPVQVSSSSEIKVWGKTEEFTSPCITDGEFKEFLSVLNGDYTRSSKGYSDKISEHNVHKVNSKNLLNCNNTVIEISTSDSDKFSVSSSDSEDYNIKSEFENTISRYFDRKNEFETSKRFVYFGDDNEVFFEESCEILDQIELSSDDSWLDEAAEPFNVFGDPDLGETDGPLTRCKVSAHDELCLSNGFENPCFKEDSPFDDYNYIKMVNDNWKINTKGIPEDPKEAKSVSFASSPVVRIFEPDDDGYRYSFHVMDQMRFRNRILDFEIAMAPFLTPDHRERVFRRNILSKL